MTDRQVVWNEALLGYDLGNHPHNPVRVELTIALAGDLVSYLSTAPMPELPTTQTAAAATEQGR